MIAEDVTVGQLSEKSVLVVDDERFSRVVLTGMLRKLGAAACDAANGEEALAVLEGEGGDTVDCVIVDFDMPRMNGLELLKSIRTGQYAVRRDLRVVMLTANTERGLIGAAMALDVDAFLIKPSTRAVIGERVGRAISMAWPLRAAEEYAAVEVSDGNGPSRPAQPTPADGARMVGLDDVPEGAVLAADVLTRSGICLLGVGQELSARTLQSLRDIQCDDDPIDAIFIAA